jgi:hypothetical protein
MFSTDHPYASMTQARAFLDRLPVSPVDRERISHSNAERLLRLFRERGYEAGAKARDGRVDGRPASGTIRRVAEGEPSAKKNDTEVHNTRAGHRRPGEARQADGG